MAYVITAFPGQNSSHQKKLFKMKKNKVSKFTKFGSK